MAERKTKNTKAAPKTTGYTAKGYTVPEGEEKSVHVEIEERKFSAATGRRLNKPYVQKFNPLQFKRWYEIRSTFAMSVNEVLHLPEGMDPKDFPADPDPSK